LHTHRAKSSMNAVMHQTSVSHFFLCAIQEVYVPQKGEEVCAEKGIAGVGMKIHGKILDLHISKRIEERLKLVW